MEFELVHNSFKGIVRAFVEIGSPKLELFAIDKNKNTMHVAENILNFSTKTEEDSPHYAYGTANGRNPYIGFYFPNNLINVNSYVIQSHFSEDKYMRSWDLKGSNQGSSLIRTSNDQEEWTILNSITDNDDLFNGGIGTYNVSKSGLFSAFKIEMTGNTTADSTMRVLNFEIYGIVYGKKLCFFTSLSINHHYLIGYILISLLS